MLKNKDFEKWLNENKIIYDKNDNDMLKALYSEFIIETENKTIRNIFIK